LRGLEILKDEALNVKVVPMPDGLDPDDVVKQGASAYQKCLDMALPLIDYKIHALEKKYDISKTEDKRRFIAEALQVVADVESEAVKEELLKKLREKTGVSYHALERDLQKGAKQLEMVMPKEMITETDSSANKQTKAIRFILAAKLFSQAYAKDYDVQKLPLTDETHIVVAQYILEREEKGERIRPSELFEILEENSAELNQILDLNFEDKLAGEVAEKFFADSVKAMEKASVERDIAELNAKYSAETNDEERKKIAQMLSEKMRKRNELKRK